MAWHQCYKHWRQIPIRNGHVRTVPGTRCIARAWGVLPKVHVATEWERQGGGTVLRCLRCRPQLACIVILAFNVHY